MLEKRIKVLIEGHYRERNCLRLVKRLKREKGMLFFTFLKEKKRNATGTTTCSAERAIRPSVVVRKVTYGEPVNDRGQGACSADEYKGDVQAAKGGGLLL